MARDEYGLGGVKRPQANLKNREQPGRAAVPRTPRDDMFGDMNDERATLTFDFGTLGQTLDGKWGSDPDADFFDLSNAQQRDYAEFATLDIGYVKPWLGRLESHSIGSIGELAPYPPAAALTHKLQAVDIWTPNTLWGGGYIQSGGRQGTYPTIEPTLRPPLEMPRYSYAAVDSDALYAEAQQRVQASLDAIYGKMKV